MTKDEFKALRLRLGLTQKEFAEKLGLGNRVRVTEIENGTRGISGPIEKLCEYLGKETN